MRLCLKAICGLDESATGKLLETNFFLVQELAATQLISQTVWFLKRNRNFSLTYVKYVCLSHLYAAWDSGLQVQRMSFAHAFKVGTVLKTGCQSTVDARRATNEVLFDVADFDEIANIICRCRFSCSTLFFLALISLQCHQRKLYALDFICFMFYAMLLCYMQRLFTHRPSL